MPRIYSEEFNEFCMISYKNYLIGCSALGIIQEDDFTVYRDNNLQRLEIEFYNLGLATIH
tara:strand:+ start:61 stop:240 length:180 start_codon:yes stop_codon:yes gene_type:complete